MGILEELQRIGWSNQFDLTWERSRASDGSRGFSPTTVQNGNWDNCDVLEIGANLPHHWKLFRLENDSGYGAAKRSG